jgi:hypothetical protein
MHLAAGGAIISTMTDDKVKRRRRGVHRFTFDGRYAYLSPELDGYLGNIVMILDLIDPAHPREIGRWWLPGQWIAGGETPRSGRRPRLEGRATTRQVAHHSAGIPPIPMSVVRRSAGLKGRGHPPCRPFA